MRLTKLTFLLLLLAAKQLIAQNDIARWAFTDSSEMQAIRFYHAATGNNARIYTGLLRQNYSLQNFNGKAKVTDDSFVFNKAKYPGVEEVDLR